MHHSAPRSDPMLLPAMLAAMLGAMPNGGVHVSPTDAVEWPPYTPLANGYFSSFGNHRFNVTIPADEAVGVGNATVLVTAVWRRSDAFPLSKAVFVTGADNKPIACLYVGAATADAATFAFAPAAGGGDYFLYYMPLTTCEYLGGSCPYGAQSSYVKAGAPRSCAAAAAAPRLATPPEAAQQYMAAYEARAPFESFEPMEMPMTAEEHAGFVASRGGPGGFPAIVVAESREHPIRMKRQLPHRWVGTPSAPSFAAVVQPGENFTFQIAVLNNVTAAPPPAPPMPAPPRPPAGTAFCAPQSSAANSPWYIKTGGDPRIKVGWRSEGDPTATCCRVGTAECRWYVNEPVCRAALKAGATCMPCDGGCGACQQNLGCPTFECRGCSPAASPWHVNVTAVAFTDLDGPPDAAPFIAATLRCMNTGGVDFWGRSYTIGAIPVPMGEVLPLWVAAVIPPTAARGVYTGRATVAFSSRGGVDGTTTTMTATVALNLTVSGPVLPNGGDDDADRGTRLHWFDSRLGFGGDTVPAPYSPISVKPLQMSAGGAPGGAIVALLGKAVTIDGHGLPLSVQVDAWANHPTLSKQREALGGAVTFGVGSLTLGPPTLSLGKPSNMSVAWSSTASDTTGAATVAVAGTLDCTGYTLVNITVTARAAVALAGVRLVVPTNPASAFFAMGLGQPGGLTGKWLDPLGAKPGTTARAWKWDGQNGNNAVWFGSTKAGLRVELKGDDPLWWAGVPYDSISSPTPPVSWSNGGQGGITAHANGTAEFYSGPRAMATGESISYTFSMMATPVRPFNTTERFHDRWTQAGGHAINYTDLAKKGVTVVNMHQGNQVNPWINYPFLTNDAMRGASEACKANGMAFSIYNTMRELSDRCREYWAMLSFGGTLVPGNGGGGADWLQEHIRTGYLPAWSNPISLYPGDGVPNPDPAEGPYLQDAGMRVVALSRWNNYYIAGLRQVMRDYGADGIYLDEIAYDRTTMLRARKVLGDGGKIDHHAHIAAFAASSAMNYMELYPFINRLWYGEGFNYNTPHADNWLIETAAFGTGLSADMLRYTSMGHTHGMTRYAYRGMLVGSAFRFCGDGPFNPVALWALWDAFGIQDAEMVGWWEDVERSPGTVPVSVTDTDSSAGDGTAADALKITVYVKKGVSAMIVVTDWDELAPSVTFGLDYDWAALGLREGTVKLTAPSLPPFQVAPAVVGNFPTNHTFTVEVQQGGVILLLQ